jgi:hypothetical protein
MQTVTEKFDSLASAYLAAHQFELEGKSAVVLDECMGSLYPPTAIRGIRVVAFTTTEPELQDTFAQASPVAEEKESEPAQLSPLTFLGLSCVTGGIICAMLGLLLALFIITDFSDQVLRLPLGEMFSWRVVGEFRSVLIRAGDVVLWSSIEGFISAALVAPLLGVGLLALKYRDTHTLANNLLAYVCFVIIAVLLIT